MNWINEMNELTWMNWHWMNWNKWIEMNELKRTNWNEWIEMKQLKGMKCQKCFEPPQFFTSFFVKSSSRYSLVHVWSTTFQIEACPRANRDPPAATTDGHFTCKNRGFRARWFFSREFTHSRLLALPNYFMMMWFTWWSGPHVVRQVAAVTIVCNSEVFKLNFLWI